MLQTRRGYGLMAALFAGGAMMAGCSDPAMGPSTPSAVKFPTTVSASVATREVCQDITFESFAHGTTITNQLSVFSTALTVTNVLANNSAGGTVAAPAKVYAGSTHSGGPDFDLELIANGGLCDNCTNMLVIQEMFNASEGGATSDNTWGGTLTITGFPAGTYIKQFSLADHEDTEADARLIIAGTNVAPVGQPNGVNHVLTFNTTSQPLITGAGIQFIFGNPPEKQGSEGIDNIKVCRQEEVPGGCTYTKGWYQNKNGAPTVLDGVDGRSKADAQAIFAATPGKPGNVTWGVGAKTDNKPNDLLNLYQQFLAAINNLGGDGNVGNAPASVQNAINAVRNATGGSGQYISISASATKEQISSWIDTLSGFNEGSLPGWPHCGDETTSSK